MTDQVEQIAAYLGLIVQHSGGEVRIPFAEAEQGLPDNSGVRITIDDKADEIVFSIQEITNGE